MIKNVIKNEVFELYYIQFFWPENENYFLAAKVDLHWVKENMDSMLAWSMGFYNSCIGIHDQSKAEQLIIHIREVGGAQFYPKGSGRGERRNIHKWKERRLFHM